MNINDLPDISLEELFNSIPAACVCFNRTGDPVACNSAVLNLINTTSRTASLPFFVDEKLKKSLMDSASGFVYTIIKPDNEQIQLTIMTKVFKHGYIMGFLQKSNIEEARGQLMLNSAPLAVSFFDSNFDTIDCNLEAARMFGFRKKEEYLEHFHRLMPPIQPNGRSSKKLMQEYISEAFEQGVSKHEFVRQKIDGSLMHTEASFVRVEDKGGYVVMGYSRDLTDVYAATEREREARETSQIYMDTSPVGMELWNEQMEIVDCNNQIVEMFGFLDKNAFLSRVRDVWQPDGDHIAPLYLQIAFDEGVTRFDEAFVRLNDNKVSCEVRLQRVIRDNSPHVIAYFTDLSEVAKAMDKVREADKRAMLMLDSTPLACFLVQENVTALDCNMAAVELFGFEDKEDALMHYHEIFVKPPVALEWVNTDEPTKFIYDHKSVKTGEVIPCEVTMVYLEVRGIPIIASYMHDLRELRRKEAQLKRVEIAEEESRAKSQFLARMSHEIRTPLNAIMGVTDIQLLKGGHRMDVEEAFSQVRSSSHMLLRIINDILDLSKVEAGKMEIANTPYEIASLIYDTVQLNNMHVGSKSINFTLQVSEDIPNILIGDELRIKQVLNNLLSNAFKYTREGEVKLSFDIERTSGDEAMLMIELNDTGQGMTEEQIASLFDNEYVRFNQEDNRLIEGTGLGMNITNRMVSIMNGHISAKSTVGEGSIFYVRLPQRVGSKQVLGKDIVENLQNFKLSQQAFQKRHTFEYEQMPYGKVLVVDDVETNLFVAKGLLLPYGLTVDTAINGYEAIDRIKAGNIYDIIFMDHMMPGLDGIETAKALRGEGCEQPIVALTANTILGQAELFMSNGFAGFISKPIDVTKLNGYLMSLIRDKQPQSVLELARVALPIDDSNLSGALIDSFLRDAGRALGILEALLDNPDWTDEEYKLYTINTHGMKSALANVNKAQLSGTAASLEQAGRDKSAELIRSETRVFLDELQKVVEELTPKDVETVDASDENLVVLKAGLHRIQTACDAYKKKAAREALDELNTYTWSATTTTLLSDITTNLLHSEFEQVSEDIDKFLDTL